MSEAVNTLASEPLEQLFIALLNLKDSRGLKVSITPRFAFTQEFIDLFPPEVRIK